MHRIVYAVAVALMFAACGGGDESSESSALAGECSEAWEDYVGDGTPWDTGLGYEWVRVPPTKDCVSGWGASCEGTCALRYSDGALVRVSLYQVCSDDGTMQMIATEDGGTCEWDPDTDTLPEPTSREPVGGN